MSKIHFLNKLLSKEVHKLKKENNSKQKWENGETGEGLKMKDEEICILRNHNKNLLDEVKILKGKKTLLKSRKNKDLL